MCSHACISFVVSELENVEISDKKILEVGSYNVNGTVRHDLMTREPESYIGVDIAPGNCVDQICNTYDLVDTFGENSHDIVISTEMMEHVKDWRKAIENMKLVCSPGGRILITTRSKGFPFHNYPEDWWRYEVEDMRNIFSDFEEINIISDPADPGVFVHVRKPESYVKNDLSLIELFQISP